MDFRALRTFVQVAEVGSFTKAAEKLGYSQPTISFQIKQLETDLQVKLFERIGHNVQLTDSGRHALSYAQSICRLSDEMIQGTGGKWEAQGQIHLGMPDSLCSKLVVQNFPEFRQKYPHMSVIVHTADTQQLYGMLDRNELDIVCTLDSHLSKLSYVIAHEKKIRADFVCSCNHPLAAEKHVTLGQLLQEPFLLTEKGMSYRRIMDEQLARQSLEIKPVLELGSTDLILQMVKKNVGLSFLPDFVTEQAVQEHSIVRLPVEGCSTELWLQLLYHRDKWMSYAMEAAIEQLSGSGIFTE